MVCELVVITPLTRECATQSRLENLDDGGWWINGTSKLLAGGRGCSVVSSEVSRTARGHRNGVFLRLEEDDGTLLVCHGESSMPLFMTR